MKNQKLKTSYVSYSDANFENKAAAIVENVVNNPSFPSPTPDKTVLTAAVSRYSVALVAAAGRGRNAVAEKNAARKALEGMLFQLGAYVMNVANGDVQMLISSGFDLAKAAEPRYIGNPGNVSLSNGISSGEMVCAVRRIPAANGYVHEICDVQPDEKSIWTSVATTASKYTFKGLQPGKQYWVRVAATGARQQIAYSPVANQFAQ